MHKMRSTCFMPTLARRFSYLYYMCASRNPSLLPISVETSKNCSADGFSRRPAGYWEKFSISNNRASDEPHWLRYCLCAKITIASAALPCKGFRYITLVVFLSNRQLAVHNNA